MRRPRAQATGHEYADDGESRHATFTHGALWHARRRDGFAWSTGAQGRYNWSMGATEGHAFTDPATAVAFALAGNATFTLQSERTGAHFTYLVQKGKKDSGDQPAWFVKVREGSDFVYLGMITGRLEFRRTAKSKVAEQAPRARAFRFFWEHVLAGNLPPALHVCHTGLCGRCGRPLTHPDSIEAGIGPECAKKRSAASAGDPDEGGSATSA